MSDADITSTTKTYCSQRVYAGSFHGHTCQKPVTCERNGKPYCTIHDPERVAAKKAEKSAAWDAKWKRKQALIAECEAQQAHAAHCVAVHEQLVEALRQLLEDSVAFHDAPDGDEERSGSHTSCGWCMARAALEKAGTK